MVLAEKDAMMLHVYGRDVYQWRIKVVVRTRLARFDVVCLHAHLVQLYGSFVTM